MSRRRRLPDDDNDIQSPQPSKLASIATNISENDNTNNEFSRYFSVVYGKVSTKKHKSWSDDGVLVCNGRTAVLKSTDGTMTISQGSSFATNQLMALESGSRIVVGSYQVEVQDVLTADPHTTTNTMPEQQSTTVSAIADNANAPEIPVSTIAHHINDDDEIVATNTNDNVTVLSEELRYSVVYGKVSSKKHKKWSNDGVLVCNEQTVILQSADSCHTVSRASSFAPNQLMALERGSRIVVGSYEVEIVDAQPTAMSIRKQSIVDCNRDDLPSKTEYIVFCRPSELQSNIYRMAIGINSNPRRLIDLLRNLSNHPVLLYNKLLKYQDQLPEFECLLRAFSTNFMETKMQDSGKLAVLSHLLAAFHYMNEKVVIVSNASQTLDLIEQLCMGFAYDIVRLDAETPLAKGIEMIDRFNRNEIDNHTGVCLLSTKAGFADLNLIGASRLVIFDMNCNSINDHLYAMTTIWRNNQKRSCHIYRLVTTGTIDENMLRRQMMKKHTDRDSGDSATTDEYAKLFIFETDTDCNTHDLMGCTCTGVIDEQKENDEKKQSNSNSTSSSLAQLFEWKHYRQQSIECMKWLLNVISTSDDDCDLKSIISFVMVFDD